MAGKAVISLCTGLEDPEKVTVAFLVAVGAAESGRPTLIFQAKEAVRLALNGVAAGVACDGCPGPHPELPRARMARVGVHAAHVGVDDADYCRGSLLAQPPAVGALTPDSLTGTTRPENSSSRLRARLIASNRVNVPRLAASRSHCFSRLTACSGLGDGFGYDVGLFFF